MIAAVETLARDVGVAPACDALNLSRATWYRHQKPAVARAPRPKPARALSEKERKAVLDVLHSPRFVDSPPAAVHATLMDEGACPCSWRTMYRILAGAKEVRERRDQLRHPNHAKPELLATGPRRVFTWDITKLRGPVVWTYFYLYVLLDLFSRYVVGWMLARCESAALAEQLIAETCAREKIDRDQLVIHSDRGAPMTSQTVAQLLCCLGVTRSLSRPHVSNDNPFIESHFKTLKYRPTYPDRFGSFEDALAFCRDFFPWYNEQHKHSALGWLTPADVHLGRAPQVLARRQAALTAAWTAHPERFVRGEPRVPKLPAAVWINPPVKRCTLLDALGKPISKLVDPNHHPKTGEATAPADWSPAVADPLQEAVALQ
jgi:putative transposase